MTAPQPSDEICDPACGTAGFLVAAAEYVREQHPGVLTDAAQRKHFHASMFHGYDFDSTMLRIGSMNMLLHGVESPDIRYRDSLSEGASGDTEKYTLILANPPFAGIARLRVDVQGPAAGRQDQEDRAAVPGAVPEAAQARRPRGGHRARRRAVRLVEGAQGAAPHAGRGPEARRGREAAVRCVPPLRRCLDRHPVVHQDQLRRHRRRLVLRRPGRRVLPRRQAQPGRGQRPARRAGALGEAHRRPSASGRAPSSHSACRRPTSSPRATTCR